MCTHSIYGLFEFIFYFITFILNVKAISCKFSPRVMRERELFHINVARGGSFVRNIRIVKLYILSGSSKENLPPRGIF